MSQCPDLPGNVVRAAAGFQADKATRYIDKSALELATRYFDPQHDGATLIETDEVERVLADVDADRGDRI